MGLFSLVGGFSQKNEIKKNHSWKWSSPNDDYLSITNESTSLNIYIEVRIYTEQKKKHNNYIPLNFEQTMI